jgi:hypothetical protein
MTYIRVESLHKIKLDTHILQPYNHYTTNIIIVLIIYGTLMKHGFKLANSLEEKFWIGEHLMQFTTPSQSFGNG